MGPIKRIKQEPVCNFIDAVKIAIDHNFIAFTEQAIEDLIDFYKQPFHFGLIDLFKHNIISQSNEYIKLNEYACIMKRVDDGTHMMMLADSTINKFIHGLPITTLDDFINMALKCHGVMLE